MDDGDDVQGTFDAEGAFIPVKVKVVNVLHLVFEAVSSFKCSNAYNVLCSRSPSDQLTKVM